MACLSVGNFFKVEYHVDGHRAGGGVAGVGVLAPTPESSTALCRISIGHASICTKGRKSPPLGPYAAYGDAKRASFKLRITLVFPAYYGNPQTRLRYHTPPTLPHPLPRSGWAGKRFCIVVLRTNVQGK